MFTNINSISVIMVFYITVPALALSLLLGILLAEKSRSKKNESIFVSAVILFIIIFSAIMVVSYTILNIMDKIGWL